MQAATGLRRVLVLAITVVACSNEPTAPSTPIEMFNAFWRTFDREYSYFEYKRINWDSLRAVFRPARRPQSEDAVLSILRKLVVPLRDVHVQFTRSDGSVEETYFPSYTVNWDEDVWRDFRNSCGFVQRKPFLG